jgi:putative FmdB family regulatory protein
MCKAELMPLYDFRCHACGTEFEARAAIGELAACESCGSTDVERVLSGFAGPFTVAPRGAAAKRSDDSRRAREQQRQERARERQSRRNSG